MRHNLRDERWRDGCQLDSRNVLVNRQRMKFRLSKRRPKYILCPSHMVGANIYGPNQVAVKVAL